jgi:hypothetical protein
MISIKMKQENESGKSGKKLFLLSSESLVNSGVSVSVS